MFQFPRVVFPLFVNMIAAYSSVRHVGLKVRNFRSSCYVPYVPARRSVMMMAAATRSESESDGLSARKKRKLSKHSTFAGQDGGVRRAKILYEPRTPNQQIYVDALNDPAVPVVFGIGPAGSGKTMFACLAAVNALKSGAVSRIVMTRPVVSVDEQLGFLPGDIQRKMDPWVRPLFDVLLESSYSQVDIDRMIAHGVIEIAPLGFMRGRTFKHTFVLADELQNSTPSQMMMLLTRIGTGCKMVVTGDVFQSDLRGVNGLADFMEKFRRSSMAGSGSERGGISDIALCELDSGDIQRSAVVQRVHDMYSIPYSSGKPTVGDLRSQPWTIFGSGQGPLPCDRPWEYVEGQPPKGAIAMQCHRLCAGSTTPQNCEAVQKLSSQAKPVRIFLSSSTQVPSVIESMSSSSSTSEMEKGTGTKRRGVEDAAMIPYDSLPKHRSGSM